MTNCITAPHRRRMAYVWLVSATMQMALHVSLASAQAELSAPPARTPVGPGGSNTTVIERSGANSASASAAQLKLVALLAADGQQIDQGLVWRVFQSGAQSGSRAKLIAESREASPALKLAPGDYTVNAAFGRAHLTRKIGVKAGQPATEQFVLNAGGLRIAAMANGKPTTAATYAIYSDDRDQFANRAAVMSNAKPGLIIRLNAGIYHIVSTYGDANAHVETDVTVEAGKLTEAALTHEAGIATFKLVMRTGGEAIPDTHWSIRAPDGEIVKESVGALPSHMLAPGTYRLTAKAAGRVFNRDFVIRGGETSAIEVMMDDPSAAFRTPAASAVDDLKPSIGIKSP